MAFLDIVHDRRVDCYSALTSMSVGEFLELVGTVYGNRGGIEGQRAPLKTKTGLSIRSRLVEDLRSGAVIPPVVIGVHGTPEQTTEIRHARNANELLGHIGGVERGKISIIDGMQRTTALLEASAQDKSVLKDPLRVEFWISQNLNSLIYRMLVLNTGQVPWEISRQLETIYSQLLEIIKQEVGEDVNIFSRDDGRRRSDAGQYQASSIVRLFLAFSSRRAEIDLKDRVAEDFARLDAIEASSHKEFLTYFIRTLKLVVALDKAFSRAPDVPKTPSTRIADGKEIFQSYPALVGFFVAAAIELFDQPGFEVPWNSAAQKMAELEEAVTVLTGRLNSMTSEEVGIFLELDLLNDRLSQRSGQVGRFEQNLFIKAFTSMLDNAGRLKDMTPCWMA